MTTALALAGVEGVLWLAGMPTWRQLAYQDSTFTAAERTFARFMRRHSQQPGRGYRVPGSSIWLYRPFRAPGYTVNRLGFRGPLPGPRQPHELRVAVLGGSSVYGWLVADDATLPAFLETQLQRMNPGVPVTVLNFGIEGFRLQQEVELAERLGPSLAPDLLVFVHGANDVLVARRRGFQVDPPWQGGPGEPPLVTHYRRPGLVGWLREEVKRSRLVTTALLLRLRLEVGPSSASRAELSGADQVLLDQLVGGWRPLLDRAATLEEDLGCQVVMVMQPTVFAKTPRSALERVRLERAEAEDPGLGRLYVAAVPRLLSAAPDGVDVIDLSDPFDGLDETVFQDWVHLSPAGNRLLAQRLARRLDWHRSSPDPTP